MKRIWIASAIVMLTVALIFAFHSAEENALPENVLGVWKTSKPRYKDRFLELKKATVTFGTGNGTQNEYSIERVEKRKNKNKEQYTITCLDHEGTDYKFYFYYEAQNGGIIRFKNQMKIRWTRSSD